VFDFAGIRIGDQTEASSGEEAPLLVKLRHSIAVAIGDESATWIRIPPRQSALGYFSLKEESIQRMRGSAQQGPRGSEFSPGGFASVTGCVLAQTAICLPTLSPEMKPRGSQ